MDELVDLLSGPGFIILAIPLGLAVPAGLGWILLQIAGLMS